MMMEARRSSETSVLTKASPCNIPEEGILRRGYLTIKRLIVLLFCQIGRLCFDDMQT
jgi:hypothetical protein